MDDDRKPPEDPVSLNIGLPAQSDGSIRFMTPEERQRVARIEQRRQQRPEGARLAIAVVALIIGGLTIWYTQVRPDAGTPHAASADP